MRYWPALDGLRGLAVIAVMLFHGQWHGAQGGFIGVDVFFVLSGFLITAQLLHELSRTGYIRWKRFFLRRAIRLQPALLFMLIVYFLAAQCGLLPPQVEAAVFPDIGIVVLALAHWARAFDWHAPDYLGHTWSLGIEEQFYLIWALIIAACMRIRLSVHRLLGLTLIFIISSAVWMAILFKMGADASRIYNGLDSRAMALLMGCALALAMRRSNPSALLGADKLQSDTPTELQRWAAKTGLGILLLLTAIGSLVHWKAPVMFLGGYALIGVLSSALVASLVIAPNAGETSLLRVPLLVQVGRWSYGLYLWHYPIYRIMELHGARYGLDFASSMFLGTVLTVILAVFSYHVIEMPIRRHFVRYT